MMFLVKFCGYTQAESDNVRRAIAKKKGTATLLPEIEQRFIDYSSTHYDITKEKCQEVIKPFLQIILDASSYGFSWNHSDAYSAIGYISGYLRYYYPLEFLTAAFNTFTDKEEKITAITEYAKKIGIKIHDISFGHSKSGYNMDKSTNTIYKGMESIKYMNASVSDTLYELSQTKKYDNFLELLKDFPGDSRQLDILIKLGYFDCFGTPQMLLSIVDIYNAYSGKKLLKKEACTLPREVVLQFATETEKQYKITDSEALVSYLCEHAQPKEFTLSERLACELEYLGYLSFKSTDTKDKYNGYVCSADTKFSPKITVYNLYTGKIETIKCYKKTFTEQPLVKGMIITYYTESKQRSRLNSETKQWEKIPNEFEQWFKWYVIKELPPKETK